MATIDDEREETVPTGLENMCWMWYNAEVINRTNSRSDASNVLRPDTRKVEFLMPPHDTPKPTTSEIPYGYCHCGCGQKTPIAQKTQKKDGRIKGEPMRYIYGHISIARRSGRDTPGYKTCTRCGELKQLTTEFFGRSKSTYDGFKVYCKVCRKAQYAESIERAKAYRAANKERIAEYDRRRHATNRDAILERKRASYIANRESELERARIYREANREAIRERGRALYAANPERRESGRKFRLANPERARERDRAYRIANKERLAESQRRYRSAHAEEVAERARRWIAANKEKVRANNRRRRALKRGAEGSHTVADVERQYKAQKGKCYYCGEKVGKTYHIDHVIPLSRGGSDGPENLVIACRFCNLSKKDKLPHEWMRGGRLL